MTVQPSAEKINTNVGFPLRHSLLDGSKENTSNRLCTQFAQNTACPRIRFADGWGGRRPRFSPALLESIRLAARIEEIIGERIELRHSGKVLIGRCPWHQSKSGRSFVCYPEQQTWRCWGCAVGGDVFDFMERFAGISFTEAVKLIARSAGIETNPTIAPEANEQISAATEVIHIDKRISEILTDEFRRASRELDRATRLRARASFRLAELLTGGASRFSNETEWCWTAIECAAACLPRLDAEYMLLAFGQVSDREQFVLADAEARKAIIDAVLEGIQ